MIAQGSKGGQFYALLTSKFLTQCESPSVSPPFQIHNDYRQKHGVPVLTWSNSCAKHAQNWADKLAREHKFEHSHNPRYGENIAKATKMNPKADEIVWHWYREIEDFDFSKLDFQEGTGHWSQGWQTKLLLFLSQKKTLLAAALEFCHILPPTS